MTKIENLQHTYDSIQELIRFADTKATAILATNGVIAGFFFANIATVQTLLHDKPIFIPFLIPPIIFLLASSIVAAYCVAPRLKQNKSKCLIFFCDIANYSSADDYSKALAGQMTEEKLEAQLIDQVWANSRVAVKKYNAVTTSTISFVLLLISSLLFIIAVVWG